MSYTKKTWGNLPDTTTPVNATGMNDLETRIEAGLNNIDFLGLAVNQLVEGDDLNQLHEDEGVYAFNPDAESPISGYINNRPSESGKFSPFKLLVLKMPDAIDAYEAVQIFIQDWNSKIFSRSYNGGMWQEWQRLVTSGDLKNLVVGAISSKNLFTGFHVGTYDSSTGAYNPSGDGISTNKIKVVSGETYYLTGIENGKTIRILYWNDNTYVTSETKTTSTTGNRITPQGNYLVIQTGTNVTYSNVQLEKGTSATTYSPHQNLDDKDATILTSGTLGNYFSTVDSNLIAKSGNVVQIQLRALVSTEIPNNTPFYTTPYKPKLGSANEILIGVGGHYDYNDGIKWGYIERTGIFRGNGIAAGKWIHINTTFITED